ncbi:MAG: helix-turn-helix transcriptional regulator [Spirochaetales bacterium]|nr:helix-turn-helix transcriptional regulator [Spirochaetales bacterium]
MDQHNPALDDPTLDERKKIELRYALERRIRNIVARGDREGAKKIASEFFHFNDFSERMPYNPLRLSKNLAIIFNTILRLSAERGGLLPIFLHGISSNFAQKIEEARDIEDLHRLQGEMITTYTDGVYKFTLKNHSAHVRRVAQYVLQHLGDKLSLEDLASIGGCTPTYLSRIFRKEYNQTLGEFIRTKRVEEARWLMSNSEKPIAEIAEELGFEDTSYFGKVFRSVVGMSPGEYRKQAWNADRDGIPL